VVQNPFSEEQDDIMLLPARPLDVTVFHAPYADRQGNVFIGRRRELATLAHASREVFVTVEKIIDTDLFETEATAAGALPAFNVTALAVAGNGAWPLGLQDIYPPDAAELRRYVRMARTEAGFAEYLAEQGLAARSAA
jgi:glutaconate CoA-transferase subunit A